MARSRWPLVPVLLLAAGGVGLLAVAGRAWRSGSAGALTGRDLVTLLDPVAWLALAAALLLLFLTGGAARFVGAIVALAGAVLLVELLAAEGAAGWRAAAAGAAVLVTAGGIAAAAGAVRPRLAGSKAAGSGGTDDWAALDRGEDPTAEGRDLAG